MKLKKKESINLAIQPKRLGHTFTIFVYATKTIINFHRRFDTMSSFEKWTKIFNHTLTRYTVLIFFFLSFLSDLVNVTAINRPCKFFNLYVTKLCILFGSLTNVGSRGTNLSTQIFYKPRAYFSRALYSNSRRLLSKNFWIRNNKILGVVFYPSYSSHLYDEVRVYVREIENETKQTKGGERKNFIKWALVEERREKNENGTLNEVGTYASILRWIIHVRDNRF